MRSQQLEPPDACHVVGIDQSSNAIDLVKLAENTDTFHWTRIDLAGKTAFERLRAVHTQMPTAWWWDDVYLAAIEIPESRFRVSLRAQLPIVGAAVSSIPNRIEVWPVTPADWKKPLHIGHNAKPTLADFPNFRIDPRVPQDALDALAVALYARNTNAAAIQQALAK